MLTPDPQRQWFVYFNEKELGPFAEKDVLAKLGKGEFTQSAYVFTEGMTDWALVSDTPVLYKTGPAVVNGGEAAASAGPWKEQSTLSKVASRDAANPFADLLGDGGTQAGGESGLSLESASPVSTTEKTNVTNSGVAKAAAGVTTTPKAAVPANAGASLSRPLGGTSAPAAVVKAPAEPTKPLAATAPAAKTSPLDPQAKRKRTLVLLLVLVLIGAAAYYWQNQMPAETVPPPETATTDAATATTLTGDPGAPPAGNPAMPAPPRNVGGAAISDAEWAKLSQFRATRDQKGAPYMLASTAVGDKYPFVLGVLSPMLETDQVYLAVFPDPERNLMAVPKIWYLRVNAVDGFFGAGPLNLEGKELPAGRYKVLVQIPDAFLGETSFEIGAWPDDAKLTQIRVAIDDETKTLASREREALVAKLKEVKAALAQLKEKSSLANKGPRGAAEWKGFSKAWYESLLKAIRDQRSVTVGPMFFPAEQLKLMNFMENVRSLEESYELVSSGGAKLLTKTRKKTIGQELADIGKQEAAITLEFGGLDKVAAQPLVISTENVKKGLEYFVSTGFK